MRTLHNIIMAFRNLIIEGTQYIGGYFWAYLAMAVLIFVLYCLFTLMMMYFCITFAGTRVQKEQRFLPEWEFTIFSARYSELLYSFAFSRRYLL